MLGLAKTKYFLTCKDNKNNLFIATFLKKIIKKIYTSLYIRQKSFHRTTLQKMLENHKKQACKEVWHNRISEWRDTPEKHKKIQLFCLHNPNVREQGSKLFLDQLGTHTALRNGKHSHYIAR